MNELVIGIDENGLGPRLGPLVATAVALEVPSYEPKKLAGALRRLGYTDSKDVCHFDSMATGEARALAIVAAATGSVPPDLDGLLGAVSLEGLDDLRSPCPSQGREPCWAAAMPLPRWSSPDALQREHESFGRALSRQSARIVAVRSSVWCASRLNSQLAGGESKSRIDLHAFEELACALRRELRRDALVVCGRVGMLKYYEPVFGPLSSYLCAALEETDRRSAYRIAGLGTIEFTCDADRDHAPVALASLVGKLVREGFVERMNDFFLPRVSDLRRASGYHDPVTAAFVERTRDARALAKVPDRCFERIR